jgi:predicted membrane protein
MFYISHFALPVCNLIASHIILNSHTFNIFLYILIFICSVHSCSLFSLFSFLFSLQILLVPHFFFSFFAVIKRGEIEIKQSNDKNEKNEKKKETNAAISVKSAVGSNNENTNINNNENKNLNIDNNNNNSNNNNYNDNNISINLDVDLIVNMMVAADYSGD